jgi:hypothetical protein
LRPKAAPNTSSWLHGVIHKSKFLYNELNTATRRIFFELRKPLNYAKAFSPELCFLASFRVFRSSEHILRPKAAQNIFSRCLRVIHKSKFLYNELNPAIAETSLKLRKALNYAKRLSPQLCSFAMQSYKTLLLMIVFSKDSL